MSTKRKLFVKSIRAQWLGARLREHRERCGLTLKDVAPIIGNEFSTLAKYERAEWPMPPATLAMLLDVYGIISERERDLLVQTSWRAWRVNRWDADTDPADADLPFIDYSWIQARAAEICIYAATFVPALLQTRPYVETLVRTKEGDVLPEYQVANMIRRRIETQEVVNARPSVQVQAVIEESALIRRIGGADVLRDQLVHLHEVARRANVQVQVMPASIGQHPALDGSFTVLHMRDDYPPVAYLEHLGGRLIMETGRAARYVQAYQRLLESALSPVASLARIADLAGIEAGHAEAVS